MPEPAIADLSLDEDLYARLVYWHRIRPEESYQRILQIQVPKLDKFGKSHFTRTITLLRNAGVPSEEIAGSTIWTTAPAQWRRCPRNLRAEGLWPASPPEDKRFPNPVDPCNHQILEQRITELGLIDRNEFVSTVLGLSKSGVPFEKKIKVSAFRNTAPTQWRTRAFHVLRVESDGLREAREIRE